MSNLVVLLLSIIVAGIVAAVVIDYSGEAMLDIKGDADSLSLMTQGQEIVIAAGLYKRKNKALPADVQAIVTDELLFRTPSSPTKGVWKYNAARNAAYMSESDQILKDSVCDEVNALGGAGDGILNNFIDRDFFECAKDKDLAGSDLINSNTFIYRAN